MPQTVLRPSLESGWGNEWFSVDIETTDNLVVVGSKPSSGSGSPGSVFVYRRSASTWVPEVVEPPVEGPFVGASDFGSDVAVSDDGSSLFVGAPGDAGETHGAVFIYDHGVVNGWALSTKLVAPDGSTLDWFGGTVEVSGDNLAVAAYRTDDRGFDSGSVYMFRRGASGEWAQVDKLTIPDARTHDLFGNILTIEGDILVASSVTADFNGNSSQGAAYTFQRNPASGRWEYRGRLLAYDGSPYDFFGSALAISGDLLAVGAYGRSVPTRDGFDPGRGSVYLYSRDPGDPSGWKFVRLIKSADGQPGDSFGRTVDIDGDILLVGGSPWRGTGAAYAFRRDGNGIADNWRQVHKFLYGGDTSASFFGDDVAISSNTVVVAARTDSDIAWEDGAVYLFDRGFDRTTPSHPYDLWRASHFTAAELADAGRREALWGDGADPDHDGVPNLGEYFGGTSPSLADRAGDWPEIHTDGGSLIWSLPISPDPQICAVAYLKSGSDLTHWTRYYDATITIGGGRQQQGVTDYRRFGVSHFFQIGLEED